MYKILYILLFLVLFQFSNSKELNKMILHPDIDTNEVVSINVLDDFVDIYTITSGYRFDINLNFIEIFYVVDSVSEDRNWIISTDYINDKIYIGTRTQGLVVLNSNLKIIETYTDKNTSLKLSKTCGTVYDSTNGKIYSKSCDEGLLVIDKMNNLGYIDSIDSFLKFMSVSEIAIIDNKYYMSVFGYDYEIDWKEELIIADNNFNVLNTLNYYEEYNLNRNIFHIIKEVNDYIAYYSSYSRIVIFENKSINESFLFDLETIDVKRISSIKTLDENIAFCTSNGIFEYDLKNKTTKKIKINNDLNNRLDSLFRDLEKYKGDNYLAASGNGVYILDNETSVSAENEQDIRKYFNIENNILTSKDSQLSVEILNIKGQRIFSMENFKNINLENVTTERGVYILLFSINNSVVASYKYINS